jgi:hypothetical protein
MRIWLLNSNQTVTGQFVWCSNYHLRFVADGNYQILKLPLPSNERGLFGNITVILATLLLPRYDNITLYYRSRTVKQVPFIQSAHAWSRIN